MKTWTGLIFLVSGTVLAVLPRLPAAPRQGGFQGMPHLPAAATLGLAAVGVLLLRLGVQE